MAFFVPIPGSINLDVGPRQKAEKAEFDYDYHDSDAVTLV